MAGLLHFSFDLHMLLGDDKILANTGRADFFRIGDRGSRKNIMKVCESKLAKNSQKNCEKLLTTGLKGATIKGS